MQRRYSEKQRTRIRETLWRYKNQFRRYGFDVMANDIADATGADRNFVYWTKLRNFMHDKNWVEDYFVACCDTFLGEARVKGNFDPSPTPPSREFPPDILWPLGQIHRVAIFDLYGRSNQQPPRTPEDIAHDARPWTYLSALHLYPPCEQGGAPVIETPVQNVQVNDPAGPTYHSGGRGVLASWTAEKCDIDLEVYPDGRLYDLKITSSDPLILTGSSYWPHYEDKPPGTLAEILPEKSLFEIQMKLRHVE